MQMTNKFGIVIQARMGSTRFPGKALADFCGSPMLLFQVERLSAMKLGMEIVVATTDQPMDDAIGDLCSTHQIKCFRGNEQNVFARYRATAKHFKFDHVVRLTGDNPLPQEEVLKRSLETHLKTDADLTSTREILPDRSVRHYIPKGCSVDVINAGTLLSIDPSGLDVFQQEHVIPIFFEGDYIVELVKEIPEFKLPQIELSVDTRLDLERITRYFEDVMQNRIR